MNDETLPPDGSRNTTVSHGSQGHAHTKFDSATKTQCLPFIFSGNPCGIAADLSGVRYWACLNIMAATICIMLLLPITCLGNLTPLQHGELHNLTFFSSELKKPFEWEAKHLNETFSTEETDMTWMTENLPTCAVSMFMSLLEFIVCTLHWLTVLFTSFYKIFEHLSLKQHRNMLWKCILI